MQALAAITASIVLCSGYAEPESQVDYAELRPILEQLKLCPAKDPITTPTRRIEEADASVYGPVAGVTLFLRATYFIKGRLKPRYWMRVEDYSTADAASERAAGYDSSGTYERLERIFGGGSIHEKYSVRLWAVARGKRVYALTTDAEAFRLISLPEELRTAIDRLPEK
jgi:hypothetical protein